MKILRALLFLVGITAVTAGLFNLFGIYSEYHKSSSAYAQLDEYIAAPTQTAPPPDTDPLPSDSPSESGESAETTPGIACDIDFPEVDFDALRRINPNVVGWIFGEDTPISYPIAQADDNAYYLEHLFNGEPNGSGAIFLDFANSPDFSDQNSILYGHNMRNGTMFAALMKYKEPGYYEAHSRFLLLTPEKNYTIELFAGFPLSGWGKAWTVSFPGDKEYTAWLEECMRSSLFHSDIIPTSQDRIVTLSTCTYEFDDARFVLIGILKEA